MKGVLKLELEKLQAGHADSENTSEYGNVANDIIALRTALLIPFFQNVTVMALMSLGIAFPSGISWIEKKFQEMDQKHLNFQISMLIISNLSTTTDNFLTEWQLIPAYHCQLAVHHLKENESCSTPCIKT